MQDHLINYIMHNPAHPQKHLLVSDFDISAGGSEYRRQLIDTLPWYGNLPLSPFLSQYISDSFLKEKQG